MNARNPAGYAYIRFSTSRQGGDDKDSTTRQKESIRLLALQHNVEIPDENFFYENGVSAYTGKNLTHGKLKDLIDQIDSLRIRPGDYVFVESIDRLSRQRLLQAKELVNGILEKGIVLVTTIDNQKYEKASEKNGIDDLSQDILLSVISKRAHEESRTKSIRRKSAWTKAKNSADESQKIFNKKRPPFGVRYNETTESFEPHREQAAEVVRIFESLKLQGVTLTIKEINKDSLVRWTNNRVKDIFESKYPLGFMYSQKKVDGKMVFDKYIENYYPQIISYQLFEEARQAMQQRKITKRVGRSSVNNVNIFRHTAICGNCGESMFFSHHYGTGTKHYYNLSCRTNFEQTEKCSNRIRYDIAVRVLFDTIHAAETQDWLKEKDTEVHDDMMALLTGTNSKILQNLKAQVEAHDRLYKEFIKIMLGNTEKIAFTKELVENDNELRKQTMILENLERSFESFTDGVIPQAALKRLSATEEAIARLKEEREKMTTIAATPKSSIKILTLEQFKRMFMDEKGRLELINFLVTNGLKFGFSYNKVSKILRTDFYINKELITSSETINDGSYLERHGFRNLGEEFKVTVSE